MKSLLLAVAVALALPAAHAQVQTTTTAVSPALEVQRLAPQLVGFAGSDLNFANLVNGLAFGVPVTLTTPLGTGGTQIFTFTPTGTLTSVQIAQVLEQARQALIARGVAAPSAQQVGTILTGGALATAAGTTPVNALVNTSTSTTPTVTGAAGATTGNGQSPANAIQNANSTVNAINAATGASAPRNMSDSPLPRGISDTPPLPVPGVTTAPASAPITDAARPALTPSTVAPTAPALAPPAVRTGDR
jgi:hypothetical protein